jgi:hypothetical protein
MTAICALPPRDRVSRMRFRDLRSIRLRVAPLLRFGLLRQLQSVSYLDTEVANGALELRVA